MSRALLGPKSHQTLAAASDAVTEGSRRPTVFPDEEAPNAEYERLFARRVSQSGRAQIIHSSAWRMRHDRQIMSPVRLLMAAVCSTCAQAPPFTAASRDVTAYLPWSARALGATVGLPPLGYCQSRSTQRMPGRRACA